MLPLTHNSLTAQSLDAKIARRQQRYASSYSVSYVHKAPAPPAPPSGARGQGSVPAAAAPAPSRREEPLAARHEIPTVRSLSEILRDAEADPELQGEGFSQASLAPQRGSTRLWVASGPRARRRLRHALLGGTAAAMLCGAAGLAYYGPDIFRAAGSLVADSRPVPGLPPVAPQIPPQPQPEGKTQALAQTAEHTATAPSGQDGTAEILALRTFSQSTAPLRLPPAAADAKDRATPAVLVPTDTVARVPVPAAPSGAAEPAAARTLAETAPGPQPEPAGTVSPGVIPSVLSAAAEANPAPPQAASSDVPAVVAASGSKPFEAALLPSPAPVPVVTVTARPAPGHEGTPIAAPRPVEATSAPALAPKPVGAVPPPSPSPVQVAGAGALLPAEPKVQPDASAEAAAVPPGFTAQQMTSTLALVKQMALLVHDMHDENVKYRAEVMTLTGTVQAKASDFEKRLRLAEARSSIAAAIGTAREPAVAPELSASDPGSARGEAPPAARATSLARSVRDYRIRRASYDYAELVDPNAPLDQQVPLEVVVGDRVPGVGRVKAITVLGGAWVVRTDHGVIQ